MLGGEAMYGLVARPACGAMADGAAQWHCADAGTRFRP